MTNKRRFPCSVVIAIAALLVVCPILAQAPAKLVVSHAYIFSMAPDHRAPFLGYLEGGDGVECAGAMGDARIDLGA